MFRYTFTVPHQTREITDEDWRTFYSEDIKLWKTANKAFESIEFETEIGRMRAGFNFSNIIREIEDTKARYERFIDKKDQSAFEGSNRLPVGVEINFVYRDEAPIKSYLASSYISFLLHEFFISMQICFSGSCEFRNSYIDFKDKLINDENIYLRKDIDLAGFIFDGAYIKSKEYDWLNLQPLPFDLVHNWVQKSAPRFSMIGTEPTGKCIIAVLHLAADGDYSPTSIMWIFYALETLFSCQVGENFSALCRRISEVLELNGKQFTSLKKNLRELYNLRSAFVHGGMQATHPLRDDGLDRANYEKFYHLMPSIDFGIALLLKCLQMAVIHDATSIRFVETPDWN